MNNFNFGLVTLIWGAAITISGSAHAEKVVKNYTNNFVVYTTTISGKECRLDSPYNTPETLAINKDMLAKIKANNKTLLAEQMKLEKPFITDLYKDPKVKENIKLLDTLMDRMICGKVYNMQQLKEYYKINKEFEDKTNVFVKKVAKANPNHKELLKQIDLFLEDSARNLKEREKTFLLLINHFKLSCNDYQCERVTKL